MRESDGERMYEVALKLLLDGGEGASIANCIVDAVRFVELWREAMDDADEEDDDA